MSDVFFDFFDKDDAVFVGDVESKSDFVWVVDVWLCAIKFLFGCVFYCCSSCAVEVFFGYGEDFVGVRFIVEECL